MNDETVKNGRKTWLNEGSQQMSGYTEIETRPADLIEDGCEGDFSRVNELYQQEQVCHRLFHLFAIFSVNSLTFVFFRLTLGYLYFFFVFWTSVLQDSNL